MGKTISILGLGWLGQPLATALSNKGFNVKGSVTSAEKVEDIESQIDVSVIKIGESEIEISDPDFFKTDVLFINIPPKRIPNIDTVYPAQLANLIPFIEEYKIPKVIFISSTSVYPESNNEFTESAIFEPDKTSGLACMKAEDLLLNSKGFATTIIRFGGLIGADRNPHRFMLRGSKNGPGAKRVNLIHLDDCIGIIEHIIDKEIWGEVINACCPEHPTRQEFYTLAAKISDVDVPEFDNTSEFNYKVISSEKLVSVHGYKFKFNSPIDYLNTFSNSL